MDGTIVFLLIVGFAALAFVLFSPDRQLYCKQCHTTGPSQTQYSFGMGIELISWVFFIYLAVVYSWVLFLPALVISAIRYSTKKEVCGICKSTEIIPTDSPAAIQIQADNDVMNCPFCAETIKKTAILCKHCSKDLPQQG